MLNNEKRYLISRFVNLIGNSIYNICIPLYLLEKFESLMITGAFFTLVQIPMVVLLPFIGSYLKNKNFKAYHVSIECYISCNFYDGLYQ